MYICVKTNENLDKLVADLLKANLSVDVSRHNTLTWIECDLKKAGLNAYVAVYSKELIIHTLDMEHPETKVTINFDDIETIYEID